MLRAEAQVLKLLGILRILGCQASGLSSCRTRHPRRRSRWCAVCILVPHPLQRVHHGSAIPLAREVRRLR